MRLVRVNTEDGSDTFFVPGLNEHYHSVFGAVAESQHVFINQGFQRVTGGLKRLSILEVGFGTGLNALLTQAEAETKGIYVQYTSIEPFPLERENWTALNYPRFFCSVDYTPVFHNLHESEWGKAEKISPYFTLIKLKTRLEDYSPEKGSFGLVYFDAFGPDVQPELWKEEVFRKLYACLQPGGLLMTYSVKGSVTRAMKSAGFSVEKIPGPPGKREITRALKATG